MGATELYSIGFGYGKIWFCPVLCVLELAAAVEDGLSTSFNQVHSTSSLSNDDGQKQ
jgi:hypothetical protein